MGRILVRVVFCRYFRCLVLWTDGSMSLFCRFISPNAEECSVVENDEQNSSMNLLMHPACQDDVLASLFEL